MRVSMRHWYALGGLVDTYAHVATGAMLDGAPHEHA